jgi:hypothetical protein
MPSCETKPSQEKIPFGGILARIVSLVERNINEKYPREMMRKTSETRRLAKEMRWKLTVLRRNCKKHFYP